MLLAMLPAVGGGDFIPIYVAYMIIALSNLSSLFDIRVQYTASRWMLY
jgi:hypothetical protein